MIGVLVAAPLFCPVLALPHVQRRDAHTRRISPTTLVGAVIGIVIFIALATVVAAFMFRRYARKQRIAEKSQLAESRPGTMEPLEPPRSFMFMARDSHGSSMCAQLSPTSTVPPSPSTIASLPPPVPPKRTDTEVVW